MRIVKPIVFFDTETTGVNTEEDRIVSIATVKITPDGKREQKHILINPGIPIPAEATAIHGITDEDVKDAPPFKRVAKAIFQHLYECDLGGYNTNGFDIPLLAAEFKRCDIDFPTWEVNYVDGLLLERMLNPNTLAAAFERYTGEKFELNHDAAEDTDATLIVINKQLERIKSLEGYPDSDLSPEEIDSLCQGDSKRFDLAGKAVWKDEELIWTFGQHRGKPVLADLKYLDWVCGPKAKFPFETVQKLLNFKAKINE